MDEFNALEVAIDVAKEVQEQEQEQEAENITAGETTLPANMPMQCILDFEGVEGGP